MMSNARNIYIYIYIYIYKYKPAYYEGIREKTVAVEMFKRYFVIRKQHIRHTANGALIILLYGSMMDALGVSVAYIKNLRKQSS